jgi:hypothetical protein
MTDKTLPQGNADADDQPGACYITDPQSGQQKCHYITKSECDQRNGVFYGGLCPPLGAESDVKLRPGDVAAEKVKKTSKKAPAKKKKKPHR